jgi:DNA primase
MSEHDGSSLGKSRIADELMPYVRAVADDIVRDGLLTKIAQRLRVDRQLVTDRFNKSAAYHASTDNFYGDDGTGADGIGGNRGASGAGRVVLGTLEESFLRILMTAPELIVQARQYISPEMFIDTPAANIYSIILEAYDRDSALCGLHDFCTDDPEVGRLISMLAVKPALLENIQDELVQKILMLRRKFLKAQMGDLREKLRDCSESEKGRFLEELRNCGEQLRELDLQG